MVDDYHINLIEKYLQGDCTLSEKIEVETWFVQYTGGNRTFYNGDPELIRRAMVRSLTDIYQKISLLDLGHAEETVVVQVSNKPKLRWLAIAATFLLLVSVGGYVLLNKDKKPLSVAKVVPTKIDIEPGGDKAILTLADGKQIVLDDAKKGQLATQGNTAITKTKDGQITYRIENLLPANEIVNNTLTTPRGGQFRVTLPDGSEVWLNAASSITYPSAFTGNKREVELTGEAYFEIQKNPERPFTINVNNKQQVEVLGTHFNIEAYTDDNYIKTTLIEGSVKLNTGKRQLILTPGQMAINKMGQNLLVKQADVDEVMAWKNGMLVFNNENIVTMMKRISRWYDIDVSFIGNMKHVNFVGNYSRTKGLATLLNNIELAGKAQFKIEGRRVTVIEK